MRSPFDPALEDKKREAYKRAARNWRLFGLVCVAALLWLFYIWGYADGMAYAGYRPG
jgi:hypothetical protein